MTFDKALIAGKLRRWEKYLDEYRLPAWEELPDIGLYMDQVVTLLTQYLDYMPPEMKEEQIITPAAINNYVRKKIMPEPVKKKYYRRHIAYLIMVCTLKQCLSIPTLQAIIPAGLDEEELIRRVDVHPGDVCMIPSGCVHAIGAGIMLYEIQQSSDITYRFWRHASVAI